ncbi:acetoin dehydrogenase dihydrolipoyllysine-residue acetyltransferase subunit [Dongia sp.]|uniref:acetoin dehydrogenase dihydrolipoyllysine-residue acetyltransferase subunit n=1 Tax=Dongia sp. TaxID=1977262 RepID=UPI0035B23879
MSQITPVTMPTWGLSMEEGTLVKWLVPEGSKIAIGTEIAEIETTKITNVLEAQEAGILRRHVIGEGETRNCGALIAVIAPAATDDAAIDAFIAEAAIAGAADVVPVRPQPQMVDIGGGAALRYFKLGDGGVPAVLLHGFGGDLDNWQLNHPILAADRAAFAIDLPGHGESTKELTRGDLGDLAALVTSGIDALGLERFHLIGHSLGAAVALALASAAPQRIATLSLIAPYAVGVPIEPSYAPDFIAARKTRDLQKVLARLFADPSRMSRDMVEGVARAKRLDGAEAALSAIAATNFTGTMARIDIATLAAEIPVAVIWGERDAVIPPPAKDIAGVAMHYLSDIGHMPHLEAAEAVNAILSAQMGDAK